MTREPYASAKRVFWIVDNGASHRGRTAAARLCDAFPNAVMIHTPVHASWLNQIEIYFSVVQRKLLTPDNAANLDAPHRAAHRFRGSLQPSRSTLRLDIQPCRLRPAPPAHRRLTPDELTGATTSSAEPIAANPRVSGHWERARGSGTDVSVKWFRGSLGSATGIPSLVVAASCSRFCHWASVLASPAAPNHIEVGQLLALDHVFGAVDSKGRIGLRRSPDPTTIMVWNNMPAFSAKVIRLRRSSTR
jgi:hypothetical protein